MTCPPQSSPPTQMQQNMLYLDPFDTPKLDQPQSMDIDHAYYSSSHSFRNSLADAVDESDAFFEELDDLSRATQTRGNPSQVALQNIPRLLTTPEFDPPDLNSDLLEPVTGGNNVFPPTNPPADKTIFDRQKRKAQNRAAQRAFRERKERHVKELEAKVAVLEDVTTKIADENRRLKTQLAKMESENNDLKGSNIKFSFPVIPSALKHILMVASQ